MGKKDYWGKRRDDEPEAQDTRMEEESRSGEVLSNFKTAWHELLGGKPKETQPPAAEPAPVYERPVFPEEPVPEEPVEEAPSEPTPPPETVEPVQEPARPLDAIITRDLVIEGSITATDSNIHNSGTIRGNVTSQMDFISCGVVEGNIVSDDAVFYESATVVGNVIAKGQAVTTEATLLVGNVSAVQIVADGRIKGNLFSNTGVCLRSNAVVLGNVTAKSIVVEEGCVLRGFVDVSGQPIDENELFDTTTRVQILK